MVVVSQRTELIAYYERRGYTRTGKTKEYPTHLNVGVPLKSDLTVEYLEKTHNKGNQLKHRGIIPFNGDG